MKKKLVQKQTLILNSNKTVINSSQNVEFSKNSLTERIAKSRYLGIEIDKELKIDIHCKKLLKRASKVASKIYHTLA